MSAETTSQAGRLPDVPRAEPQTYRGEVARFQADPADGTFLGTVAIADGRSADLYFTPGTQRYEGLGEFDVRPAVTVRFGDNPLECEVMQMDGTEGLSTCEYPLAAAEAVVRAKQEGLLARLRIPSAEEQEAIRQWWTEHGSR